MQNINRLKNVISQEDDLELLHELRDFPVFMGCVDHGSDKDLHVDQSWSISSNNGIPVGGPKVIEGSQNRAELDKVLDNYCEPKDSLKYEAACFLIENMAIHTSNSYNWIDNSDRVVSTVSMLKMFIGGTTCSISVAPICSFSIFRSELFVERNESQPFFPMFFYHGTCALNLILFLEQFFLSTLLNCIGVNPTFFLAKFSSSIPSAYCIWYPISYLLQYLLL